MAENTDSTVAVLQEIAGLLRRRVEQTDEQVQRSEEARKESDERMAELNLSAMHKENKKWMGDSRKQAEQQDIELRREKEQAQAEEREFRQNLLAEFARHNVALERLIARLDG